jgi:ATP-dependent exoDNAse (exonuclease V) alpha subunit
VVRAKVSVRDLDEAFNRFQLLCSTHEGAQGVAAINVFIEQNLLAGLGYRDIYDPAAFLYHGKAILVTKNHTDLGVFNGDIGYVMKSESSDGKFCVVFPQGEGKQVVVSPLRLKSWQPAYAMTVHKSQGSEYQNVGLLLASYAKELLSRPLVYTGLTRAKQRCDIWATSDALERAFMHTDSN